VPFWLGSRRKIRHARSPLSDSPHPGGRNLAVMNGEAEHVIDEVRAMDWVSWGIRTPDRIWAYDPESVVPAFEGILAVADEAASRRAYNGTRAGTTTAGRLIRQWSRRPCSLFGWRPIARHGVWP
jgi:hypothetical protein